MYLLEGEPAPDHNTMLHIGGWLIEPHANFQRGEVMLMWKRKLFKALWAIFWFVLTAILLTKKRVDRSAGPQAVNIVG